MLVTEGTGLPVGFYLASAQRAEVRLAEATLATIRVPRRRGRPRKRPKSLVADRGYDSRKLRRAMRHRGIRPCIPPRRYQGKRRPGRPLGEHREAYAQRWIVERTFAWLGNFRRLVVRYEHRLSIYRAFFTIACIVICLGRILQ